MSNWPERQQLVGEPTAKLEEGAAFCLKPNTLTREIED
jgi:hypothetical protein